MRVWQETDITMKTAIKNCIEWYSRNFKSSHDEPKYAYFDIFSIFLILEMSSIRNECCVVVSNPLTHDRDEALQIVICIALGLAVSV